MILPLWSGVEALRVRGVLGAYDWERDLLRDYEIDVKACYDAVEAVKTDDLALAIDYAQMANLISTTVATERFRLLESCAASLVGAIFKAWPQVNAVWITVRKPASVANAAAACCQLLAQRTSSGWQAVDSLGL